MSRFLRELWIVLAWLGFPLVPVVLEDLYYRLCTFELFRSSGVGPDPHEWNWFLWVVMLGPLLGYGFLAGATMDTPDEIGPSHRGLSRFLGRRAVWVAVGPWWGFLAWVGLFLGASYLENHVPGLQGRALDLPESWKGTWISTALWWIFIVFVVGTFAYGWIWPARAAMRRAARSGRWGRTLHRGLVTALAFVGSLFGSFWAMTSWWRSYFFDSRVVPLLAATLGLAVLSGCSGTITYGELRRRELFHAMLVAWVLGLALMWRWWSRPRPGPPGESHTSGGSS